MIEVLSSCPTSRQDDQALTCVLNFTTYLWHKAQAGLRGCPTTLLTPAFVILSEAKNLMDSGTYNSEILRLVPQNDVVGQPLDPPLQKGEDFEVETADPNTRTRSWT